MGAESSAAVRETNLLFPAKSLGVASPFLTIVHKQWQDWFTSLPLTWTVGKGN